MGVPVKSLLRTMSFRLGMQEDGTTHPHIVVADATRILVGKLQELDNDEDIEIAIVSREPLFARYIRTESGEVLAEINMTEYEQLLKPD